MGDIIVPEGHHQFRRFKIDANSLTLASLDANRAAEGQAMKLCSIHSYALVGALLSQACPASLRAEPSRSAHPVDIVVRASAAAAAGIAARVQVRGCVVDASYVPHAGAVILRSEDGRLITRALTDAGGTFVARVPPQQRIHIALDAPDGDTLTFPIGVRDAVIESCMRDNVD